MNARSRPRSVSDTDPGRPVPAGSGREDAAGDTSPRCLRQARAAHWGGGRQITARSLFSLAAICRSGKGFLRRLPPAKALPAAPSDREIRHGCPRRSPKAAGLGRRRWPETDADNAPAGLILGGLARCSQTPKALHNAWRQEPAASPTGFNMPSGKPAPEIGGRLVDAAASRGRSQRWRSALTRSESRARSARQLRRPLRRDGADAGHQ